MKDVRKFIQMLEAGLGTKTSWGRNEMKKLIDDTYRMWLEEALIVSKVKREAT